MNEREVVQRELSREKRTMQRQKLLKRLRKLDREGPKRSESSAAGRDGQNAA